MLAIPDERLIFGERLSSRLDPQAVLQAKHLGSWGKPCSLQLYSPQLYRCIPGTVQTYNVSYHHCLPRTVCDSYFLLIFAALLRYKQYSSYTQHRLVLYLLLSKLKGGAPFYRHLPKSGAVYDDYFPCRRSYYRDYQHAVCFRWGRVYMANQTCWYLALLVFVLVQLYTVQYRRAINSSTSNKVRYVVFVPTTYKYSVLYRAVLREYCSFGRKEKTRGQLFWF